jgi:DNA-binding winged helix-turn-helix (wHTH) protein/tetratricopeptide (TPR) repeat protein
VGVSATQKLLGFGVFELNVDTEELFKSAIPVKLPPQPLKLLVLLASRAGQVVPRNEIQQQLWVGETFVDFEHGVNKCINQIRTAVGDNADRPLYIETLPRRGYRFVAPVVSRTVPAPQPKVIEPDSAERSPLPVLIGGRTGAATAEVAAGSLSAAVPDVRTAAEPATEVDAAQQARFRWSRIGFVWIGVAVLLIAVAGGGLYWRWHAHKAPALTEKDTIVLADFDNKTGDPVFDNTLKQGLDIQLGQSPFLNLISQDKVNQTLKLMGRSAGDVLTPEVARDVCQRTGSKAMLSGSIDQLGSQYVIGLKAVNCETGDVLAQEQKQAAGKEAVLKALDAAAVSLRSKLGESLSSVQKYATPLEEATTPSLDALKAYSQGREMSFAKGHDSAMPFYQRAVELDPNFASAYAAIAGVYFHRAEVGLAAENARKAYELRGKVSERERLHIEASYYMTTTGELEKAAEVLDLYQQTYPRDFWPWAASAFVATGLGNWEKALEEAREAIRLEPKIGVEYTTLAISYASLNRLDEGEAAYKQAEERKIGSDDLLPGRYLLAFLKGDTTKMARLVSDAMRKPGTEDVLLANQADTEGWYGRLKNARELTRRAMDSAQHNDAKETAALYQAVAALREVESGYGRQARADADAALDLAPNRDVRAMAALALARAGDTARAEKLAAELDKAFPLDTIVQRYWLPTIRAAAALQHKEPDRAVELLKPASPIELGQSAQFNVFLCPVYLRGEAYLTLGDGNAAAAEFQKFIDHYGLVVNFPWGALARLGVARANAQEAATDPAARGKARAAYQNFLTLWKDADPDVPILIQAKAEYAKLANNQ